MLKHATLRPSQKGKPKTTLIAPPQIIPARTPLMVLFFPNNRPTVEKKATAVNWGGHLWTQAYEPGKVGQNL